MKHGFAAAAAAIAGLLQPALATGAGAAVTPVQKVAELLQGMLEQGKAEKVAEQKQFAAFKQFCDDTTVDKNRLIQEASERIEVLTADVEKNSADAEELGREIAVLEEDISVWTGDLAAAKQVRTLEKDDYTATHQDYTESIDALERAIDVVKKQARDRSQVSLAQVAALTSLRLMPSEASRMIDEFLQQDPSVKAPQALGYEFRSHGIIEMFNELLNKFVAEKTELEKHEMESQHHYDLLVQDLSAQIQESTNDRDRKASEKAKKLEAKAAEEGELGDVSATRDADQAYVRDLTATCQQKAADFEARQQLRTEELQAVETAIEIVSGSAVAGNAAKHLPAMVQASGSSLVHLRAAAHDKQLRARLSKFLEARAARLGSRALSSLAERAADDPFEKVKQMIQDLLVRLMEEANAEAEHKGWCDNELSTNEQTRSEKTAQVETLHAEIDQLEASVAKLTSDLAEHAAAIESLDAAMAQAAQLRQEEKAKNEETIADAKAAQAAVAQAIAVLKDFYAKAATATSLAQQGQQPEIPQIFGSAYTGMQGENGGVVGMLEVIESDFARLEADTRASEATAESVHDRFMEDSKADKAQRIADSEHLTQKRQDENQELTIRRKDLDNTQVELDAALGYFDKLKPSCIDAGVSYEDRVARRQEELDSLRDALKILSGSA